MVKRETWMALTADGLERFDDKAELYIRPMYWADSGTAGGIRHDPESTRWCLCIYEAPLPKPRGAAITLSPFRRPTLDCAPVDAKAGCLYPNNTRALLEAQARGFDNCLLRDALGNVAELATANVFLAKDGAVFAFQATGQLLGAHLIGPEVTELLPELTQVEQAHSQQPVFECRIIHGRGRVRNAGVEAFEHLLVRVVVSFAVSARQIGISSCTFQQQ